MWCDRKKLELLIIYALFRVNLEPHSPVTNYWSGPEDASALTAGTEEPRRVLTAWASLSSAFCLFQVTLLQQQLAQERKYKQDYIECCAKTSQELSDLHQELSYSLAAVVREPNAAVLEAETQKLDRSLNHTFTLMSLDCEYPERQPLHSTVRSTTRDGLR